MFPTIFALALVGRPAHGRRLGFARMAIVGGALVPVTGVTC
jgi:fucose permease